VKEGWNQRSLTLRHRAQTLRNAGHDACIISSFISGENGTQVLRCTLRHIPVPSATTSWEDIEAFRANPDAVRALRKLRLWAIDESICGLKPQQIHEMISDHVADYERYLHLAKIQFTSGAIESILVGGAQFLEDLLKFRLGSLASRFFSVRKERAALAQAEMGASGRHLSFITHAKMRFDHR